MSTERLLSGTQRLNHDLRIQEDDSFLDERKPKFYIPQRWVISVLVFIGVLIVYVLRVNLSVAILPISEEEGWDPSVKGVALSSFFWGYICTQILGALLANRFGGKPLFGYAILGASFFTGMLPFTVSKYWLFLACRIATGFFEGASFPSVQLVIAKWIPDSERSSALSFMWSGAYFGSILAMLSSPILINAFGWRSIFYSAAVAGLVWFIVWMIVAANSPQESRFISEYEKVFIRKGIFDKEIQKETPWKQLFSKAGVWAIVVNYFCMNWGFYTLLTWMPTYMKQELNFDLQSAGFLSVQPYVAVFLMTIIGGRVSDMLLARGWDKTLVRKLFYCTGTATPALFLALLCKDPTPHQAVAYLVVAVGITGLSTCAIGPNTLDIAGEYSGILLGVGLMLGNTPGIIAVAATGFILEHTNNSWCVVFLISSGVYVFGCIVWALFATGKRVL